jgi:hypothetical protein
LRVGVDVVIERPNAHVARRKNQKGVVIGVVIRCPT